MSATHLLKIVIQVVDQATPRMNAVKGATERIDKNLGQINKRMNTFDMRLLSTMFGGMALARAFGGITKSIINTFLKAEDHTSGLAKATVRLSASWEFLKFSIMDALNTDWFINFIDGLIKVINWFSQLDAGWRITFLAITGGLFIIGTGLMIISQFKLFWDAVFGMGGFLRNVGTIRAGTVGPAGVFTQIGNIARAGFTFWLVFEGWKKFMEGDIAAVFGNLATGVVLWTAGLGYAVPFYLIFKGLQFGIPKLQEVISEAKFVKDIFPEENIFTLILQRISDRIGIGGAESIVGKILGITPELEAQMDLIFPDETLTRIVAASTNVETVSNSIKDKLIPENENLMDSLDGEKQSVVKSLEHTGGEMDTVSGEKTDGFIAASDSVIAKNNETIASNDALAESFERVLSAFGDSVDAYKESSPVKD